MTMIHDGFPSQVSLHSPRLKYCRQHELSSGDCVPEIGPELKVLMYLYGIYMGPKGVPI